MNVYTSKYFYVDINVREWKGREEKGNNPYKSPKEREREIETN